MASVTQTQRDKLVDLYKRKLQKLEQAIHTAKGTELKILDEQAKDLAAESLGIKELYTECLEKVTAIANYRQEITELHERMDERLDKPDGYYRRYYGGSDGDPLSAYAGEQVRLRQEHHRRILLGETTFGAKLNRIEELKENMEEQVMRATSSKDIQAVMDDFDQVFKHLVSMD